MINHLLLALCLLLSISRAGAQNQHVIPPSPTASALASYVDNPVSLYTGTPEITIPLYTLQVKDFELPVSLSYHSKGIKVDEVASNIGMGWSLNAGGVITRAIKGFPDDYKAPACGPSNYEDCRNGLFYTARNVHDVNLTDIYTNTLSDHTYSTTHLLSRYFDVNHYFPPPITNIYPQWGDTEPDIFYFNFCGYQGKFVFEVIDGQRTIRLMPHQDLKITYSFDGNHGLIEFKITDNNGIIYTFGAAELTEYRTVNEGWPPSTPYTDGINWLSPSYMTSDMTQYHSSWYLSKIETPLGAVIDFSYEAESYLVHHDGSETTLLSRTGSDTTYNPNTGLVARPTLFNVTDIMGGKRLSRIESKDIRIDFQSGPAREDIYQYSSNPAKPLSGLVIYYKRPLGQPLERILRYQFFQTYFQSNTEGSNEFSKRLFLQSMRRYGATDDSYEPSTGFEYKYSIYTGNPDQRLPYRLSKSQDLWGYYNAAPANNTSIPALYIYPDMYDDSRRFSVYRRHLHTGREYYLPGADRLPNRHFSDVGMLTKIMHPTGGHTTYEYEPHTFQDGNEAFSGGGLRIKKITKYDGHNTANNLVYEYSYTTDGANTSGALISMPVYAVCDGGGYWHALNHSKRAFQGNTIRFSYSQAPLGTTQGSNIGYRQVTERLVGKGKTVYHYSLPAYWHQPNDGPSGCDPLADGYCDGLYQLTPVYDIFVQPDPGYANKNNYDFGMNPAKPNTYPFPENPNYDWNRGQLLRKELYNEDNVLVQNNVHTYALYYPQGKTAPTPVYGLKFGRFYPKHNSGSHGASGAMCFRVAKYHYLTDVAKVPASVTTTRYDQDNPARSISSTTWYTYGSSRVKKLTEKRTEQSDGSQLVSKYKYAADYFPSSPPPDEGVSIPLIKQMKGILVEEAQFVRSAGIDRLIGGRLSTYHEYISLPVPYGRYTLQTASPQSGYTSSEYQGPVFSFNSRYQRDLLCRRYDSQGNLLEASTPDGTRICYVWGYQRRYPVAKVINATYNEIEALLTSADFSYLMNGAMVEIFGPGYPPEYMHTPEDIRLIINKLRTGLPNAQVYTYTYKPPIGMNSETSPAGITTSYEYDGLGRLRATRDHDGNIVEMLDYYLYKSHE